MINDRDIKVTYQGNGSTTVFPFTFPFIQKEYIHVAIYDSETKETTTLTENYYVDAVAKTVTYPGWAPGEEPAESQRPPVLPETKYLTIYRATDIDQLSDLGDKYPLPVIEEMSDKLTEIAQELEEGLSRSIKVSIGDPETPEEKWTDMQTYVSETEANKNAAAASAAAAANSALESAGSAAESAASAAASANSADASASSARQAANSALEADANATRAAESQAANMAAMLSQAEAAVAAINEHAVPAWDETKVYSYPAVVAYTDGNTYRCIGENIPAGTTPPSSQYWIRITTRGGDDFFDIDIWGGLMPAEDPVCSYNWELDSNGDIMPKVASDNVGRETKTLAEEALDAAEEALEAANAATAAANALIASTPMELDDDGDVTPVEIPEEDDDEEEEEP